jgi:predicted aspartyl protease
MGTFRKRIELAATPDGRFRNIYALVDTGSLYTWVPGRTLRDMGIEPTRTRRFRMANGKEEDRDTAEAVLRIDGQVIHTIVVFGEETEKRKDLTLLGAYALEGLALAVDPVNKRLVQVSPLPAAAGRSKQIKH